MNLFKNMILITLLTAPISSMAVTQLTFDTPEAAVEKLMAALKGNDEKTLFALFGEDAKDLISTGDKAYDTVLRKNAAEELEIFHSLDKKGENQRVILMGSHAWPMPIPLALKDNRWHFETSEGKEEIFNRRIGANERNAISVLYAYLSAQHEYARHSHNEEGVLEYAQKLGSTPGKHDGLYWKDDASDKEGPSPFGPLVAESSAYLVGHKKGDSYRGYHFKILTSQGSDAPGGAYNYIINNRMLAGFAMIAYPDDYGKTGIMTFLINQNGKIYQQNLGQDTESIAEKIDTFNPDSKWKVVEPDGVN